MTMSQQLKESIQDAKNQRFRALGEPYFSEVQDGWSVEGTGNFREHKGGVAWSHLGWVFDEEADAREFYKMFKDAE